MRVIGRLAVLVVALGAAWAAPAQAATWCGTPATADRAQQLFGGAQIHAVYAIPADGGDRLGTVASLIETDTENIDTWWRGQDPTRTPRFDLFGFSCGPQLDLTTVRLDQSAAQLAASPSTAFNLILSNMRRLGLLGSGLDSLVYYDGPVAGANSNVCGIGGGGGDIGIAIVFVNACAGAKTDWIAAHELTHAFGAVPSGAPHRCPDSGHTCDTAQDLMYPFTAGDPLANAILDPGRDDYYGHSGSWADVQDSPFLKHLDSQVHLGVTIQGTGTVASSVPGVDCSTSCGTDWDGGSQLSLTPTPGPGLRFLRWSGACTGAACNLVLDSPKDVTAVFGPATFAVTASVTGKGTVRSTPAGIVCKPHCKAAFISFKPVKLTAKPAKGWHLKAWGGTCRGKKALCTVPLTAAASARAVFVKNPPKKKATKKKH